MWKKGLPLAYQIIQTRLLKLESEIKNSDKSIFQYFPFCQGAGAPASVLDTRLMLMYTAVTTDRFSLTLAKPLFIHMHASKD